MLRQLLYLARLIPLCEGNYNLVELGPRATSPTPTNNSAILKMPALPGLLVLGDLSIQGNIQAVRSLSEPLQVVLDNEARHALIPIENKRHFLDVSADIIERVAPVFGGPLTGALKALDMS